MYLTDSSVEICLCRSVGPASGGEHASAQTFPLAFTGQLLLVMSLFCLNGRCPPVCVPGSLLDSKVGKREA